MNTRVWIGAVATLGCLMAQEAAGDWQGTLKAGPGLRVVVKIGKAADGNWTASMLSIDQSPDWGAGIPANSVSVQGSTVKFGIDMVRGTYEGTLSADGNAIDGSWTQGLKFPLELKRATAETAWKDPSPHKAQMVRAEPGVELEVLDWGGSGRSLVLLAGLGNSAHIFDKFAPKLTDSYRVYGITRRGYGSSSVPSTGYDADRLGDDVVAVLDQLKIDKPVLAGHSIAGEELSSVASRRPGRVAGVIYLDAAYGYAYYDKSRGDVNLDLIELQSKLEQMRPGKWPKDPKALVDELLVLLPRFEGSLREKRKELDATPPGLLALQASAPMPPAAQAIMAGQRKYSNIPVPALAIYAVPRKVPPMAGGGEARAAYEAFDTANTEAQAKAFAAGVPSARIVRLPRADHYVFFSNEADVLREMRAFLDGLTVEKAGTR